MPLEHVQDYVTLSDCYDLFNERLFEARLRADLRRPGQHFGYYRENGSFLKVARELLRTKSLVRWYKEGVAIRQAEEYAASPEADLPPVVSMLAASFPAPVEGDSQTTVVKPMAAATKVSYRCPDCRAKAWGKSNLSLICGKCYDEQAKVVRRTRSIDLYGRGSGTLGRPRVGSGEEAEEAGSAEYTQVGSRGDARSTGCERAPARSGLWAS